MSKISFFHPTISQQNHWGMLSLKFSGFPSTRILNAKRAKKRTEEKEKREAAEKENYAAIIIFLTDLVPRKFVKPY